MATEPQPAQAETITCTYDPDVARVETWLKKMVAEMRFIELIVAVVALIVRLRNLNTHLMRRVAHLTRKRPPSETLERLERQLVLAFPGDATHEPERGEESKPRRRGKHPGRRPLPAYLRREPQFNPVPDELRTCPNCGTPMDVLGHESCEVLNVRPAEFFVTVRKDEAVVCPKDGTIVSAPPPSRIVPKGKLGDSLIVEALADKYLLHLPIERQCTDWARQGIDIPPHTLGRSVAIAVDLLGPLAAYIVEQARRSEILSIDSTGIRLLDPEAPEGRRFGTMWCGIGDGAWASFYYWPAADAEGAVSFLGTRDFTGRIVQSDGTPTINFIERGGGKRPGCWAHGRRRLVEAARSGDLLALDGLRIIAKLFLIEEVADKLDESLEQRQDRRDKQSSVVLEELRGWVDHQRGIIPPKSPLGRALGYIHRQWPRLVLFVDDGRLALTNNHVERAIRPLVQGLKNWLFAYGDLGGRRTADILTVIGTCIAQRINPRAFLHRVLGLIVGGWAEDAIQDLVPHRLAERYPELKMPARASPDPDEASLAELMEALEAALLPSESPRSMNT